MSDTRTYYAKVESGVVTAVHVVTWDFLVANPERYGDSSLWLQVFPDNSGRGYCAVGDLYDAVNDVFFSPEPFRFVSEVVE
jgi:hypothetical protein